jgi:hypothetical protein
MHTCPYCGEVFEGRHGRDLCVASHFSGEKKLPKSSRKKNIGENLLKDFRKEVSS